VRVLAVDHGTARCGCAISDPTETIATPIETIEPATPEAVAELARARGAELVVVGLPLGLSGEEGLQAGIAREFTAELAALLEVPVDTYDERLTTRMAERTKADGGRAAPDSVAAAHLLDDYLRRRSGARGS